METHKFITRSALEAVEKIRGELGPRAVVLEVRQLPRPGLTRLWRHESFEITAAIREPEPAPADPLAEIREEIRQLRQTLTITAPASSLLHPLLAQAGLLPRFADQIVAELQGDRTDLSLQEMLEGARVALRSHWREPGASDARCHVFVGPPGSGKSTALCKFLAQHILVENRGAAVAQLDTHTANLSPLPRFYAEVLGAHFSRTGWDEPGAETVFIDLPGVEMTDDKGWEATAQIIADVPDASIHLVLNAAYDSTLLIEQAERFAALRPADLILTHLDEEPRWGKLWNLLLGTNFCIRALSAGQNVPGGLLRATPEQLLTREFGRKPLNFPENEHGRPSAREPMEFVGR